MQINKINMDRIEDDLERRIVQGVASSLELKYESLKEKDNLYHMLKKDVYLEYKGMFIEFKSEFEEKSLELLKEAVKGDVKGFSKTQERFRRIVTKEFEKNMSSDLDYIRKEILFEMNTLEDMIHQSIEKLEPSEDPVVIVFSKHVKDLYQRILHQLKKHQILQIYPKPHEGFDGKIHEAIVVEEDEAFEKGEIIRTQNSGYLHEKRILLRASVIAAK